MCKFRRKGFRRFSLSSWWPVRFGRGEGGGEEAPPASEYGNDKMQTQLLVRFESIDMHAKGREFILE